RLGDFSNFVPANDGAPGRRKAPPPGNAQAISASLAELARDQGIPPLLAAGMLDPDLEIHRVHSAKGLLERRLVTAKELDEDKNLPERQWVAEEQVKHKGKLLVL